MAVYTGVLSFTDDPRNCDIYSGVVVRTCIQAAPSALAKELLAAVLTSKKTLQNQCRETIGTKAYDTYIAPLL